MNVKVRPPARVARVARAAEQLTPCDFRSFHQQRWVDAALLLHLGKTASTAYDATHGYSDQYIVEVDVFNCIAKEAGLNHDTQHFSKFPASELATVSVNLLKGN
jgi:hypothetical protein